MTQINETQDILRASSGHVRPTWPHVWMDVARIISNRSYDERLRVGAIVVSGDNTSLLALGYNGNYAGGPNTRDSNEPGMSGFIHAELNCIIKLDYRIPCKKIMYVTHSPCRDCCKLIINAKIDEVIFGEFFRDTSGLSLLRDSGIKTMHIDDVLVNS